MVTSPAAGGEKFTTGYQEIEYPHVERRQVIKPAETALKVIDVKTMPNLTVGYIVGVGDQVPAAIEQLGAKVSYIEQDELAWGDLSKYDVIITGVRAYERRADLRAYNHRLLDYAERGGTVIVQYNKMEFNQAEYGPFPAKVSGNRVSDELVPVKVLVPANPVFSVSEQNRRVCMGRLGAGARAVFPGRKGPEVCRLGLDDRILYRQSGREAGFVGGGEGRQRAVDLFRARIVAPVAGRDGRCVSIAGESDQPVES